MKKGQYMALEAVLSLSIGLAVALGSISMFNGYKKEVMSTGKAQQVNMVESEVISSLYTLKETDSGYMTLDLPRRVGGRAYQISLGEDLRISTTRESYTTSLSSLGREYRFNGSAEGGSVKVFKKGNQFILRAN